MQISITLTGTESPAEVSKIRALLDSLYGLTAPVAVPLADVPSFAGAALPTSAPVASADTMTETRAPIPPAPSTAPAAPAHTAHAAPLTHASGVEVDVRGVPWDARIHALGENNAHPKNANGTWRAKRGLNDAGKVAAIEGELRAALGAPPAPPVPPAPPAPPAAAPAQAPAFPPPPVPPVPADAGVAAPAVAQGVTTFPALMQKMAALVSAAPPKLTHADFLAICQAHGVPTIPALGQRVDLIPSINAALDAHVAAQP